MASRFWYLHFPSFAHRLKTVELAEHMATPTAPLILCESFCAANGENVGNFVPHDSMQTIQSEGGAPHVFPIANLVHISVGKNIAPTGTLISSSTQ